MLNQLQYTYKTGRWWDDIRGKRQQLGRLFRWKRRGGASQAAVREARRALRRSIRRARRQCWEDSLSKAYGEDVWKISGYIPPGEAAAVPTISHQGRTATTHEDKSRMLADISLPPPVPYEGDEGQEGPPGQAYREEVLPWNQQQEKPRPRWHRPFGVSLPLHGVGRPEGRGPDPGPH